MAEDRDCWRGRRQMWGCDERPLETLWDEEEFSKFMSPGGAVHASGKQ